MDYLPLIGIAAVVVGFALRLRVTVIVVAAGFITGLAAGMPLMAIIETLGRAFANGRAITLFVLALPAIGLSERYGLQEQARRVILRIRAATVGRLQLVYQFFRIAVVAAGVRLGSGHVMLSRPIVIPMAMGTAGLSEEKDGDTPEADRVKAACAASDNYGNFFGQNLFFGSAGVALVVTTLKQNGLDADPRRIARWTIPVVIASVILAVVQYQLLDAWLRKRKGTK
jgi:uncharacterized membrane protein